MFILETLQKQLIEGDRLFLIAENLAKDFSLFPQQSRETEPVPGLLSDSVIRGEIESLSKIEPDLSSSMLRVSEIVSKATERELRSN